MRHRRIAHLDRLARRLLCRVPALVLLSSGVCCVSLCVTAQSAPRAYATRAEALPLVLVRAASWSPDGKWLACVGAETNEGYVPYAVWLGPGKRGTLRRLSSAQNPKWHDLDLLWSPDSRYLAVHEGTEGTRENDWKPITKAIRVVRVADGKPLCHWPGEFIVVTWTHSRHLLGVRDTEVVKLSVMDGSVTTIAKLEAAKAAVFKRDGRWLACASMQKKGEHPSPVLSSRLTIVDLANGRTILASAQKERAIETLSWSPDGRRIAYAVNQYGEAWRTEGLFVYDQVTHRTRRLTPPERLAHTLVGPWSPDGTQLAFSHRPCGIPRCALSLLYVTTKRGTPRLLGFGKPKAWSREGTRLLAEDVEGDACVGGPPGIYVCRGRRVWKQTLPKPGVVLGASADLRQVIIQSEGGGSFRLRLTLSRRTMAPARPERARRQRDAIARRGYV